MTSTTCVCCRRRTTHPDRLCPLCLPLVEQIRSAQSLDQYESAAIDFAIEHAGDHVVQNGADLSTWEEEQVRAFVREILDAFAVGLRAEIGRNEVPF